MKRRREAEKPTDTNRGSKRSRLADPAKGGTVNYPRRSARIAAYAEDSNKGQMKKLSFHLGKKKKDATGKKVKPAKKQKEHREEPDISDDEQESPHDEAEDTEVPKPQGRERKPRKAKAKDCHKEEAKEVSPVKGRKQKKLKQKKQKDKRRAPTAHTPIKGSQKATETLLAIWKEICKGDPDKEGFSVAPVDDNMYKWHVQLFGWDDGTQIKEDMFLYESVTGKNNVLLEVLFPPNFPDDPPFLRVVYPRFHQYTGHITAGGSICIKDLTRSGWDPKFQLASFFIMIRNLLLEGGALVDMDHAGTEYSEEEARAAFQRVAEAHGWKA